MRESGFYSECYSGMGESYVRKAGEYLEGWDAGDTKEHVSPALTGPGTQPHRSQAASLVHLYPAMTLHLCDTARPAFSSLPESKCPQSVFVS